MEQSLALRVFGRHTLSIQTLRLMERNSELRLKNINLGRKLQIMTIKTSLLRKKLFKIMEEFENNKQGSI